MKKLAILGSTGSIGKNTLNVVRNLNNSGFRVEIAFLAAFSNFELLNRQIKEFNVPSAGIIDDEGYKNLKSLKSNSDCRIVKGMNGILDLIENEPYDLLVNAFVGFAGLIPTIQTIKRGKDIALANKESLVVGGELITELLKSSGSKLIPVDSEHSAILQCINGEPGNSIKKLILTASGGPFLNLPKNELESVTPEKALMHPNWSMGHKITVDSSTLMNKGFEIIEGKWLFNVEIKNIDVLIHPNSIVHSLVEFIDGSVKAQLGVPDMQIPIQYAITYPERIPCNVKGLNLAEIQKLTFFKPDFDKFECLKLAYDVMDLGGTYPVVLNASNEIAVDLFLKKKIRFLDIPYLIKKTLDKNNNHCEMNLDNILAIDKWSRDFVYSFVGSGA
ncbi:MAG: 1-deoxy-D-xylulose-5-phosphate reductoisomerase [Ignavibacteria bacterium]